MKAKTHRSAYEGDHWDGKLLFIWACIQGGRKQASVLAGHGAGAAEEGGVQDGSIDIMTIRLVPLNIEVSGGSLDE